MFQPFSFNPWLCYTGCPMTVETYPKARSQSSLVYRLIDRSFPNVPAKVQLKECQKVADPRPLLKTCCEMLASLRNDLGNSLLHEAVLNKKISLCKLFLHRGYIDCQNDEGETALHAAIRIDNIAAFSLIVQHKPNLLLQNRAHETAVELALKLDKLHFVAPLLGHRLELLVPPSRQHTFLYSVWKTESKELIQRVAKQLLPPISTVQFTWNFDKHNPSILLRWIQNYRMPASDLTFSNTSKNWAVMLHHFAGKVCFLFAKKRQYLEPGACEDDMQIATLWTWRHFWQNRAGNTTFFIKIDQAIGRMVQEPSAKSLAALIKKGKTPVIVASGWREHSLTVVFIGSLFFICNRGDQCSIQKKDLTAYRFTNKNISASIVQKILSRSKETVEEKSRFLFEELPPLLEGTKDGFCIDIEANCQPQELNKPICTAANLRLAIRALLVSQQGPNALALYKEYSRRARFTVLHQYLLHNKPHSYK